MLMEAFNDYLHYLQIERGLSENTLQSYKRDLNQYLKHLKETEKATTWAEVERTQIIHFLRRLAEEGKSPATIARAVSSIRSFHQFLMMDQLVEYDPSLHIET